MPMVQVLKTPIPMRTLRMAEVLLYLTLSLYLSNPMTACFYLTQTLMTLVRRKYPSLR